MKICMFVFDPISQNPRVKREAERLVAAGNDVTVIGSYATGLPDQEMWNGVKLIRIPQSGKLLSWLANRVHWRERLAAVKVRFAGKRTVGDVSHIPESVSLSGLSRSISRLRAYVEQIGWWRTWIIAGVQLKADVYHAHNLNTLQTAYLCAKICGAKLVYDSHELYVDWILNKFHDPIHIVKTMAATEAALAPKADMVVTVSDGIADELARLYNIQKPLIIHNCPPLTPIQRSTKLRDLIGGSRERPIFLYQGMIARGRALIEIIAAAGLVPEADFVLMGPVSDQIYGNEIKEAIAASEHKNIYQLPRVPLDELWTYTGSADAGLVMTQPVCRSYALTIGNKIFEYMVAGIPIVASTVEGHRRIAAETGVLVLVDPYDPKDIARGIKELLSEPGKLRLFGEHAREWGEKKYNSQSEAERLVEAYSHLVTTGAGTQ